jgi:ketosteroid isomerase-like protein
MQTRHIRMWVAPALLAVAAMIAPLAARPDTAGADDHVRGAAEMITEALRLDQMFVELWNDRNFDELGRVYYVDDALLVPPNHEPIRGRDAIIKYFEGGRDAFGEIEMAPDPHAASASGNLVSILGKYSAHSGQVRTTNHELFERQPDGSLKVTVDMFGFRDPLR